MLLLLLLLALLLILLLLLLLLLPLLLVLLLVLLLLLLAHCSWPQLRSAAQQRGPCMAEQSTLELLTQR